MAITTGIALRVSGVIYDQWTSAEVTRDLKDFSGSFSFYLRDAKRAKGTLPFASAGAPHKLRDGMEAEVLVDGVVVLKGSIDTVEPDISDRQAQVSISGRDSTNDLIDCAALTDGPAEFRKVKLEDAVKRIAQPFGLGVRTEVDTGEPFERYSLDLSETAFSAIEKGARARQVLILSDGVGSVVITRTGANRAPGKLTMPGNVIRSSGRYTQENRYSKTYVRGQGEKAGKERSGSAAFDKSAAPLSPDDRQEGDGSATEMERKGTAATGVAVDDEVKRHRPIVYMARTKADQQSAQKEADWRMRTARGESEGITHTVRGFGVSGSLWRVNEMVPVSDAYQDIERDMLISRVTNRHDDAGAVTELSLTSPEAFDAEPVGNRRTNAPRASLDGKAEAL